MTPGSTPKRRSPFSSFVVYFTLEYNFTVYSREKLQEGSLLSWIYAFLTEGSFNVKVGNQKSKKFYSTSGVPQDTLLGPLLSNFFISVLPKACYVENVEVKLFCRRY